MQRERRASSVGVCLAHLFWQVCFPMLSRIPRFGWVAATVLLIVSQAASADDHAHLDFVFSGIEENRSLLESGHCTITGSQASLDPLGNAPSESEGKKADSRFEFRIVFDKERLRFDRTQPGWTVDETTMSRKDNVNDSGFEASMKPGIVRSYYYRTPTKAGFWIDSKNVIELGGPSLRLPEWMKPFDVNALGLYSWVELKRGLDLSQIVKLYSASANYSVSEIDSGVHKIELNHDEGPSKSRWYVWVDPSRGFTAYRAELHENVGAPSTDVPLTITQRFDTQWDLQGGVWVPVDHKFLVRTFSKGELVGGVKANFALQWHAINKPVADKWFTYKDFDAPDTIGVLDSSLGQSIVDRLPAGVTPTTYPNLKSEESAFRTVAILVNVVICLLLVGLLVFRWRIRRPGGG